MYKQCEILQNIITVLLCMLFSANYTFIFCVLIYIYIQNIYVLHYYYNYNKNYFYFYVQNGCTKSNFYFDRF